VGKGFYWNFLFRVNMDRKEKFETKAIRTCLRQYKREYGLSWREVLDDINKGSKHKMGHIALFRFVEGKDKHSANKTYTTPRKKSFELIVKFLKKNGYGFKSDDEDKKFVPTYSVPEKLLDYLDAKPGEKRHVPSDKITGVYIENGIDGDEYVIREMLLGKPTCEGVIEIKERVHSYKIDWSAHPFKNKFSEWQCYRKRKILAQEELRGWGVITPEDNFMVFLKKPDTGENRYYYSFFYEESLWPNVNLERLILLQQEYPVSPEDISDFDKEAKAKIGESLTQKIAYFENEITLKKRLKGLSNE